MLEIEDQLRRHAEWVRPQMPPLRSAHETGAAVQAPRPNRTPRPGRLAWTAVAAAAAVIVLAAAVAVVSSRSAPPAGAPRPTGPQTVTAGPDTALLPPVSIGNLQLWSLTATSASAQGGDTSSSTTTTVAASNATRVVTLGDGALQQVFGDHGEPVVEVSARRFLPHESQGLGTMSGPGLQQVSHRVRGLDGRLQSTAYAPGVDPGSSRGDLTPMAILWNEGGYAFTVTFRNLSMSQALAFVDGLQVGPGGLGAGFLAPTGSHLTPLELPSSDAPPTGILVDAHYATGPTDSREIDVSTCPPGAGCTVSYADVWTWGTRLPDGSVEGAVSYYGAAPNTYERVWPDGQDVAVSAHATDELDRELARQIADHVALGDRADVVAVQAQVSERLMALPRVAAAAFDLGAVEVHAAGRLTAVCLAPTGQSLTCPSATFSDPATPPTAGFNSSLFSDDGRWIVAAAIQGSTPFGYYPDTPDIGVAGGTLPARIAGHSTPGLPAGSGWELGLVEVPAGIDHIVVTQSSGGSFGGTGVSRPTS
jgi:hypothetical protein